MPVIQAWSLPAAVAQGLTQMGRNPPSLRNGTAVWEVTSGVLLRTKSRPWQVCKAEISEPLGQLMYVAVVYSKEQPLKRGLE